MSDNLCCLLRTDVKCVDCGEQWCSVCWVGITTHASADQFGKCPKTEMYVKWASGEERNITSYIE